MNLHSCSKHNKEGILQIQETIQKSGDHIFQVKCSICGKLGPKRKTLYGVQIAWNNL